MKKKIGFAVLGASVSKTDWNSPITLRDLVSRNLYG